MNNLYFDVKEQYMCIIDIYSYNNDWKFQNKSL